MIINPENYRPKVDEKSDKYSWRMYKFLKKYKGKDLTVWSKKKDDYRWHEVVISINKERTYENEVVGRLVWHIMCAYDNAIYKLSHHGSDFKYDVTEDFFEKYSELGRCFIVPDAIKPHEWEYNDGDFVRECVNCGRKEKKYVKETFDWKEV